MPITERTYSPRELATALGVSESSMKRWIDAGEIGAARTAGGHRRVPLKEVVRFIRERRLPVVDPSALGLADVAHVPPRLAQAPVTADLLVDLLEAGEAAKARGLIVGAFLRGEPLAPLCDGPVRGAMHRLGELWKAGRRGILVEHHATDVVLQAFHQIRSLFPLPTAGAPAAVGAALSGDPYQLPTLMAAAVLADRGFAVTHLGPDTPAAVLADAGRQAGAALVWLSASHAESDAALRHAVEELAAALEGTGAEIVVGGRRAEGVALPNHPAVQHCSTMAGLAALAEGIRRARGKA